MIGEEQSCKDANEKLTIREKDLRKILEKDSRKFDTVCSYKVHSPVPFRWISA